MSDDPWLAERADRPYHHSTPIYRGEGLVEMSAGSSRTIPPPGLDISLSKPPPITVNGVTQTYSLAYLTECLDSILTGYEGNRVRVTIEDLGVPPYEPSEP